MFMRDVVFPMPGSPTSIRCGLPRIPTDHSTGSSLMTCLPSTIRATPSADTSRASISARAAQRYRKTRLRESTNTRVIGSCRLICSKRSNPRPMLDEQRLLIVRGADLTQNLANMSLLSANIRHRRQRASPRPTLAMRLSDQRWSG